MARNALEHRVAGGVIAMVGDAQLHDRSRHHLAGCGDIARSSVTYFHRSIVDGTQPGRNSNLRFGMYRIREVDGSDDDVADTLAELHRLTFFDGAPVPEFDHGHWWLAHCETEPVAFAGLIPSTHASNAGYFCRVGVLRKHGGRRLQLRLMRTLKARARLNGWCSVVSDTTDNVSSANNFIRAGYQLFQPKIPWAWPNTLYWRKVIR